MSDIEIKSDCCNEPCDCGINQPMEITVTEGDCCPMLEVNTILVNGVKYVIADPLKMPPKELHSLLCAAADMQVYGPWEDNGAEHCWRPSALGREVHLRRGSRGDRTWYTGDISGPLVDFGLGPMRTAQAAVDALLMAQPNTVVVDPIMEFQQ